MSKKDEALKLALDLLKQNDEFLYLFHECESEEEIDQYTLIRKRNENAIAFAEKALAEQPAQQGPVAWVCEGSSSDEKHAIDYWPGDVDDLPIGTKLYTSPPASKPWMGLTDEEYSQLHDGLYQQGKSLGWVVDQVEAKLREKNNG